MLHDEIKRQFCSSVYSCACLLCYKVACKMHSIAAHKHKRYGQLQREQGVLFDVWKRLLFGSVLVLVSQIPTTN